MIVATRIPELSEQLRKATIAAAQKQSAAPVAEIRPSLRRRVPKRFGLMGYRVVLEQRAA
jgi:hypothetical protein